VDPFGLPKLLLISTCSVACAFILTLNTHLFKLKSLRVTIVSLTFFIVVSLFAFLNSNASSTQQLYGIFTRHTGLLTYLSFCVLMFASILISSQKHVIDISKYFIVSILIVLIVGFLQAFSVAPKMLSMADGQIIGLSGNSNYHSAFLGIIGSGLMPLFYNTPIKVRIILLISELVIAFQIVQTKSQQGIYLLAISACIFLIFILKITKRIRLFIIFLVTFIGISILTLLSLFNKGPLAKFIFESSIEDRGYCMSAAIRIINESPLIGHGFDSYADWYHRMRSVTSIQFKGIDGYCDTAHNVLLDLTVNGGILLLVSYLILNLITLNAIFSLLRNLNSPLTICLPLILMWTSYQIQSLISINQVGLAALGWILSGAIIGLDKHSNSEIFTNELNMLKNKRYSSLKLRTSLFLGSLLGFLIIFPALNNSSNFLDALRNNNAEKLNISANAFPKSAWLLNYAIASQIQTGDFKLAEANLKMASATFPDNYLVWKQYLMLPDISPQLEARAKAQLERLNPLAE
jgi:O-antigen ligase